LATRSPEFKAWGQARVLAADAASRGLARVFASHQP
jgi:hypothetical protein